MLPSGSGAGRSVRRGREAEEPARCCGSRGGCGQRLTHASSVGPSPVVKKGRRLGTLAHPPSRFGVRLVYLTPRSGKFYAFFTRSFASGGAQRGSSRMPEVVCVCAHEGGLVGVVVTVLGSLRSAGWCALSPFRLAPPHGPGGPGPDAFAGSDSAPERVMRRCFAHHLEVWPRIREERGGGGRGRVATHVARGLLEPWGDCSAGPTASLGRPRPTC